MPNPRLTGTTIKPYNTHTMPKPLLIVFVSLFASLAAAQSRPPYTGSPLSGSVHGSLMDRELDHRRSNRSPEAIRSAMLRLLGPLPARTPLNPVVLGQTTLPGMRIEKVLFDSQPGFHVTALLYLPDRTLMTAALPAIVMAPGHSPAGKAGDFAFAAAFVRNGFAVLSYDPLGQGERLQYSNPKDPAHTLAKGPTGEHGLASLQPILLGESVAKYFLWDGMRAIDYLETRPEIDPHRIGAFGCSGGGADTALLGALDPRVAAVGTACYLTTWQALLSSIGPQDGEQSTPGWIAAGLTFADYVIAAAPRPYAIIATEGDMFPFAGTVETEREARAYYRSRGADKQLDFITGPGGHGNLKPILPRILRFFFDALHPTLNAPVYDDQSPAVQPPPGALQVTPTGQVSTFDPNAETVFSLNLKHAASVHQPHPEDFAATQAAVRTVVLGGTPPHPAPPTANIPADATNPWASAGIACDAAPINSGPAEPLQALLTLHRADGSGLLAHVLAPRSTEPPSLALLLVSASESGSEAVRNHTAELLRTGHLVLVVTPHPALPGNADVKAPQLGPWYLPGLSAELVGQSILGLRVRDTLLALDYLTNLRLAHQPGITAEASGHLALVLLHAALFDTDPADKQPGRLSKVILKSLPPTYAELLRTPIPLAAPEDLLPGVLLHYDTPDLIAALGRRIVILP